MFGAGGGTSSYREVENADVILLWGSNAREAHPIFFHHVLKGIRNGAKLYVVDPRRTTSAQWADLWVGLDVGTDNPDLLADPLYLGSVTGLDKASVIRDFFPWQRHVDDDNHVVCPRCGRSDDVEDPPPGKKSYYCNRDQVRF